MVRPRRSLARWATARAHAADCSEPVQSRSRRGTSTTSPPFSTSLCTSASNFLLRSSMSLAICGGGVRLPSQRFTLCTVTPHRSASHFRVRPMLSRRALFSAGVIHTPFLDCKAPPASEAAGGVGVIRSVHRSSGRSLAAASWPSRACEASRMVLASALRLTDFSDTVGEGSGSMV